MIAQPGLCLGKRVDSRMVAVRSAAVGWQGYMLSRKVKLDSRLQSMADPEVGTSRFVEQDWRQDNMGCSKMARYMGWRSSTDPGRRCRE